MDTSRMVVEDGYIENMKDKIAFDISFNNEYDAFNVQTQENKISIYPNSPNLLRFKLNYRFISLSFKYAPDYLPGNGDNAEKGKTKVFKLGSDFVFRKWFAHVSYSKVKGFYLYNTKDYMDWKEGDPFIQFPHLQHKEYFISGGYIFNPKLSYRNLISQTERQLKSAGSFIPVSLFRYYIIDNKANDLNTQKTNNIEINIGGGYMHTFVFKERFYISLGTDASFGYLHTKLITRLKSGNQIANQDNWLYRWNGKTGIGYNGSKFYGGLYVNLSGLNYKQENTTVANTEAKLTYRLFFGIRLESPYFIDHQFNKLEKLYHN